MNTEQAMKALLDGKKLTAPHWELGVYICLLEGELVNRIGQLIVMEKYDWIIYEEPKQKVKLYKYACNKASLGYIDSAYYYSNPVAAIRELGSTAVRIDSSMIEVDA